VTGQPVNNTLHFLIGVFTCGLWWLLWLVIGLLGGTKRQLIHVDEWGYIRVQNL
jgi:hypothetical protein